MHKPLAFLCGLLFGLGLSVSGMSNPARVIGFLDVSGTWDPTLLFVMGAALLVTAIGYRWVMRRPAPLQAPAFQLPGNDRIDRPLLLGSLLFGVGWGLAGLCPGPAITALASGTVEAVVFLSAMLAGNWLAAPGASASARRPVS